jgi:hypothetical protein
LRRQALDLLDLEAPEDSPELAPHGGARAQITILAEKLIEFHKLDLSLEKEHFYLESHYLDILRAQT